jgi:hypothetical protein
MIFRGEEGKPTGSLSSSSQEEKTARAKTKKMRSDWIRTDQNLDTG